VDGRVDKKILEIAGGNLLCGTCGSSRNSFVTGNGDRPGETPAAREGPGNREFQRVSGPSDRLSSVRHRAIGGQRGKTKRGPSISCMEGPRIIYARISPG
jgi:hypothetical protein